MSHLHVGKTIQVNLWESKTDGTIMTEVFDVEIGSLTPVSMYESHVIVHSHKFIYGNRHAEKVDSEIPSGQYKIKISNTVGTIVTVDACWLTFESDTAYFIGKPVTILSVTADKS